MLFVIQNDETGKLVAASGYEHSYTTFLQMARTFSTREAARKEACGNETVYDVQELLRAPEVR